RAAPRSCLGSPARTCLTVQGRWVCVTHRYTDSLPSLRCRRSLVLDDWGMTTYGNRMSQRPRTTLRAHSQLTTFELDETTIRESVIGDPRCGFRVARFLRAAVDGIAPDDSCHRRARRRHGTHCRCRPH